MSPLSPLALALLWLGAGAAAVAARAVLRPRRALAAAPLAGGLVSLLAASAVTWPGPAASTSYGGTLILGRPGLGLLVVAGVAVAVTLVLAPGVAGGEVGVACLVGAAAVIILSATVPVVWGTACALAVGAIAVRWIAASPDRGTLAMGRVAGTGGAALLAAATFLPADLGAADARPLVAGALLAAGVGALLALLPVGGWAPAAVVAVRGSDLALWTLLLAPAVLLSAGATLPALPSAAGDAFATDLLVLALVSGVFAGVQAVRATPAARYGRLWIGDLALAAAGVASFHEPTGRLGGGLLVLAHMACGPVLLHPPRPGLERPHRAAWLTLAGVPPAAGFWGRLLVLESLAATSALVLAVGLVVVGLVTVASMRALLATDQPAAGRPAGPAVRALGWAVSLAALGLGFAPAAIAERVFGTSFT